MFQRMVAIPQEEYTKLTSVQQVRQPFTQQFYKLEQQYGEQDRIQDPYERLIKQSETLEDMKDLKERMRQDLSISTPKPYQSRALALYQSIQPFIKFNERGEIFDETGNLIRESRLEDLVQYAIRDRRRSVVPIGWSQFRTLLKSQNVPKFMLNRDTLQEMDKSKLKVEPFLTVKRESEAPPPAKQRKMQYEKRLAQHKTKVETLRKKSTRVRKPNKKYDEQYGFVSRYK